MPKSHTIIINILHSNIEVPANHVVREDINSFGVYLEDDQIYKVQLYIGLLLLWNQKFSLTTITEHRELLARHFGESVFASKIAHFGSGRLADVGSGAGFPGLAIKIIAPELQVFLIEQHAKKGAFLNEAIRLLDFNGANVIRSPYESVPPGSEKFDFVTARAIGNHKGLLKWMQSRLKPQGKALFWLGAPDSARLMGLPGWIWDPPYAIPNTRNNVILSGTIS